MKSVLDSNLCDLGSMVKVKGKTTGICDGFHQLQSSMFHLFSAICMSISIGTMVLVSGESAFFIVTGLSFIFGKYILKSRYTASAGERPQYEKVSEWSLTSVG